MTGRLSGKVMLITGAARGQGRSHAIRAAREGADIIAVDACAPMPHTRYPPATSEDLAGTVKEVEALDRRIVAVEADVRDRQGLKAAIDNGVSQLGRLDAVVANAGIITIQEWHEVTPELWQDVLDINLTGVWNTVQLSIQHLVDSGGGSILLISSAAGLKGLPFFHPYTAAKSAIVGLMRSLAFELAEHNIRVNTLHPTGVQTLMNSDASFARMGEVLAKHPRLAPMFTNGIDVPMIEPEDASNAVVFLTSDEARYVTAHAMTVDAGNTQY
ncbi:mycofactocin-coupled SDR family oxidoreductase [Pseudonocardia eucalypti]|uniref:Mycofactocin-coupled SDR family oxidoreductase n=1 Tax=Pseudonocardia eucalypti TaxID=648755 RepID=A0ABP9PNV0_9PSEU|nr:SDR family mycofactocin-dependent oxidoreductase [Pseudonocardia eucalypti]